MPTIMDAMAVSTCDPGEDVCEWVFERTENQTLSDLAENFIGRPLTILLLIVLGLVVRWLCYRVIDRVVRRAENGVLPGRLEGAIATNNRRLQRTRTLGDALKSVVTIVIIAVVGTMILSEMGIDIAPIIASAGIIGVALGFGAQSLVRDFLSGTFMILEDQLGVGDVVNLGEMSGTVEAVSLRVTQVRDINGTVWYVPNGQILRVANNSQGWARAVVDIVVAYSSDLTRATDILREVAHDVWEDADLREVLVEEPEVTGIEGFATDGVSLRIMVKTQPLKQWQVGREIRARVKQRFDAEHIGFADSTPARPSPRETD